MVECGAVVGIIKKGVSSVMSRVLLLRGNAAGRVSLGCEVEAVVCGVGGDGVGVTGIVVCVGGIGVFVFVR